jgi:hypothetical protein
MGMLWEFVRYKYSFHEYLYGFMREAQQTPGSRLPGEWNPGAAEGGGTHTVLLCVIFPKVYKISYGFRY